MTMPEPVEIEAKLRVDALKPIATRLRELGAVYVGEHIQQDDYFDDPKQALAGSDRCLRLRLESCEDQQKRLVTYKGPKQGGHFKKRQELEFEVNQSEPVQMLFAALGYSPALEVHKTRQVWEWKSCQIGLDDLPKLGHFVEIEGPDEAIITEVQTALGLAQYPHITESYACLMAIQQEK